MGLGTCIFFRTVCIKDTLWLSSILKFNQYKGRHSFMLCHSGLASHTVPLSSRGRTPLTTPLLSSIDSQGSWRSSSRFCKKARELCLPGPFRPETQPNTPTGGGGSGGEDARIREDSVIDTKNVVNLCRKYSPTGVYRLWTQWRSLCFSV